jgi:hypothetical protein
MRTEHFMRLWCHIPLRQYILDEARRHSKDWRDQEDYLQEAWMRISLCEEYDKTFEFYERLALRAIWAVYQRERRYKQKTGEWVPIDTRKKYRFVLKRKVTVRSTGEYQH